jgi:hypothetical protein
MKKIILPLLMVVISNAEEKGFIDKLLEKELRTDSIDTTVSLSYTIAGINKIDNVDIEVKPLLVGGIKFVFFPDDLDITAGYSRTLNNSQTTSSVTGSSETEKGEQLNLEVPLDKIKLKNVALVADYYKFTTGLKANSSSLALVGRENNTITDNAFDFADPSVETPFSGDTFSLQTKIMHLETRWYALKDTKVYFGFFYENIEKPWEFRGDAYFADYDQDGVQSNGEDSYTVIFTQTKMNLLGLSAGYKVKDKLMPYGLNLSKVTAEIGQGKVKMTDNYTSDTWERQGIDAKPTKFSSSVEIAHKSKIESLKSDLVVGLYGWYNHTFLMGDVPDGISAKISDDYMYGVRVGVTF